jgi:hypothetical protein
MNGRIYDPVVARFMTPDPNLQDPFNLQAYNRYSYALNNPLMFIDPTGYFSIGSIFKAVAAVFVAVFVPAIAGPLISAAVAPFVASAATAATIGVIGGGVLGGFAAGLVASGGNFQAGLLGGLTGGLFSFAGSFVPAGIERIAAHAAIGCVTTALGGGSCGQGAQSAGMAKFATDVLEGVDVRQGRRRHRDRRHLVGSRWRQVRERRGNRSLRLPLQQYGPGTRSSQLLQAWAKQYGFEPEFDIYNRFNVRVGRADIVDIAERDLWEIKKGNYRGLREGRPQLRRYTTDTVWCLGTDLGQLTMFSSMTLAGPVNQYEYTNLSGGLITYQVQNPQNGLQRWLEQLGREIERGPIFGPPSRNRPPEAPAF